MAGELRERPEHRSYSMMKNRCTNPKAADYKHYGGRGIKVCDRWMQGFPNFLEDMGNRPSLQHTLDRIDNDGDYTPENCRWATKVEQSQNRRDSTQIKYKGVSVRLVKLANAIGMHPNTIRSRINKLGWTPEEAIHGKRTDTDTRSNS